MAGDIRVGIGGWTYTPWRDTFYPPKWPHKRELEYAAGKLTAIEINGTYYSSFKPETWANWRDSVPDGFKLAVKASRYCTNRKVLADGGESVARFCDQGLAELGNKLGPILWQFMGTKRFDPDDFGAFLKLLPAKADGVALRHAVQVRHDSFHVPDFVALCRAAGVAIVYAQSPDYPALADISGDLVYVRLENSVAEEPLGYSSAHLDRWTTAARTWASGGAPNGLPHADPAGPAPTTPRDVYLFFISGAKERNPHAAVSLIERLAA